MSRISAVCICITVQFSVGIKIPSTINATDKRETVYNVGRNGFIEGGGSCWDTLWGSTPHALTMEMCRKSRAHHGDSRSIQPILVKLQQGSCLKIATLGGSITVGRCTSCPGGYLPNRENDAWPSQFAKWLNKNFPCHDPKGHEVYNLGKAASGSDYWVDKVAEWRQDLSSSICQADVVIVESASNDIHEMRRARNGHAQGAQDLPLDHKIQYYTEILARELKTLPRKPLLIWATFGWRQFQPHSAPPGHVDAALVHLPVLQYYGIEQTSMLDVFLPVDTDEKKRWLKRVFFNDAAHPSLLGHQMCAQILGHLFLEESSHMNSEGSQRADWFSALARDADLPAPLVITKEAADEYDHAIAKRYKLWSEVETRPHILSADGFTFEEDVSGKPGLLALREGSTVQLAIPFQVADGRAQVDAHLGLLKSYEHMGVVDVSYSVDSQECSSMGDNAFTKAAGKTIDCLWDTRVSVRQTEEFSIDLQGLTTGCIRFQFEVGMASPARMENKIKLLDLTLL